MSLLRKFEKTLKFLDNISAGGYLFLLFGGMIFVFYIFYRGMEMYPNK